MSSGVVATEECISKYSELKLSRKFRYIIYCIAEDGKSITLEKTSPPADHPNARQAFDDFVASLPANDCRYAVFDFEYEKNGCGEGIRNKIIFVAWSPDSAKVKSKMLYASSKDALRKRLEGIATEIQATDSDEIKYTSVLEKIKLF
jgi:cofilin